MTENEGQVLDFEVYTEEADPNDRADPRTLLIVKRHGKMILKQYDGGEPEDNTFYRDWSWVESIIEKAYKFGLEDGSRNNG